MADGLARVAAGWRDESSRPVAEFALLLTGRAPGFGISSTQALNAAGLRDHERTSVSTIIFAARSHLEFVVRAQEAGVGVDVFVHSWNPEAAALIDAQYGEHLVLSAHERPPLSGARRRACVRATSSGAAALSARARVHVRASQACATRRTHTRSRLAARRCSRATTSAPRHSGAAWRTDCFSRCALTLSSAGRCGSGCSRHAASRSQRAAAPAPSRRSASEPRSCARAPGASRPGVACRTLHALASSHAARAG